MYCLQLFSVMYMTFYVRGSSYLAYNARWCDLTANREFASRCNIRGKYSPANLLSSRSVVGRFYSVVSPAYAIITCYATPELLPLTPNKPSSILLGVKVGYADFCFPSKIMSLTFLMKEWKRLSRSLAQSRVRRWLYVKWCVAYCKAISVTLFISCTF